MYYVNRYPQVKNPLVPIFTTNAKYNNAGFTITAQMEVSWKSF